MKKTLLLLRLAAGCVFFPLFSSAQVIQSLTIQPANPTSNDTITLIADCMFPSASCDISTQFVSVAGNQIFANSLHCMGMLTMICNDADTFLIDPLPPGIYTFHFHLDGGLLPAPCTPGIVPGPNDTLTFVVSPAVGLAEMITQDEIKLFPNPSFDQFGMSGFVESDFPVTVTVYAIDGKRVLETTLADNEKQVDISSIPDGTYQVSALCRGGRQIILPLLKSTGK